MKSNSDSIPKRLSQSAGLTQFAYNITEVTNFDPMGETERTSYNYDYVAIEGEITRAKVINAIISERYSKDAEIALINNELANPGTEQYYEYQAFRVATKAIVDEVI